MSDAPGGRSVTSPEAADRDYTRGPEPPRPAGSPVSRRNLAGAPPGAAANAASSSVARIRSSAATIGSSAATTTASGSRRTRRHAPTAGGTRSATMASHVAIARARRSSSSRPSRRAASGSRSPIRSGARPAGRGLRIAVGHASALAVQPGGPVDARRHGPGGAHAPERRVEVVQRGGRDERLGQAGDPPDEVRSALRIQLREHIVQEEEWRAGRRGRSGGPARRA